LTARALLSLVIARRALAGQTEDRRTGRLSSVDQVADGPSEVYHLFDRAKELGIGGTREWREPDVSGGGAKGPRHRQTGIEAVDRDALPADKWTPVHGRAASVVVAGICAPAVGRDDGGRQVVAVLVSASELNPVIDPCVRLRN